jgi:hypothetical protein
MTAKVIQGRNPRYSLEIDEVEYIKALLERELNKNQKFDKDRIYFLLKLLKKLESQ